MRHTRRSSALLGIAALLCAGLLSACGSGSGDDDAGSTGSATPDKLTLALVPSGDANKLVESVKPQAALTQRSPRHPGQGRHHAGLPGRRRGHRCRPGPDRLPAVAADGSRPARLRRRLRAADPSATRRSATAAQFFTNNPSKYCADTPTPDAEKGNLFCNGTAAGPTAPPGSTSCPRSRARRCRLLREGRVACRVHLPGRRAQEGRRRRREGLCRQAGAGHGERRVGARRLPRRRRGRRVLLGRCAPVVQKDTPDVGKKVVTFALTDEIPNDGVLAVGQAEPARGGSRRSPPRSPHYAGTPDGVAAADPRSTRSPGSRPGRSRSALQRTQEAAASIGGWADMDSTRRRHHLSRGGRQLPGRPSKGAAGHRPADPGRGDGGRGRSFRGGQVHPVRTINGLVPITAGEITVGDVHVCAAGPEAAHAAQRGRDGLPVQPRQRTTVLNNVLMGRLHTPRLGAPCSAPGKDDVELAMQALERVEIVSAY